MVQYGEKGTQQESWEIEECANCPVLKKCIKLDKELKKINELKEETVEYGSSKCFNLREDG